MPPALSISHPPRCTRASTAPWYAPSGCVTLRAVLTDPRSAILSGGRVAYKSVPLSDCAHTRELWPVTSPASLSASARAGPAADVTSYVQSIGRPMPPNTNPAEYLLVILIPHSRSRSPSLSFSLPLALAASLALDLVNAEFSEPAEVGKVSTYLSRLPTRPSFVLYPKCVPGIAPHSATCCAMLPQYSLLCDVRHARGLAVWCAVLTWVSYARCGADTG
eukprot:3322951-Rhodomonas_salina.1